MNDWKKKQANSFQRKEIYATFDNKGFHIFENNSTIQMDELHDVSSDQEEADTKMFLWAKYSVLLDASSACIHIVDTDVLVLPFYYSAHVNNIFLIFNVPVYVNKHVKSEEHLLNVLNLDYDVDMRRALPGLLAVTGCDSVSAFFRQGKIKGLLQTKVRFFILQICICFKNKF